VSSNLTASASLYAAFSPILCAKNTVKTATFFLICEADLRNPCRLNISVLEMKNPPQWRVRESKLLFGFYHAHLKRTFRAGFMIVHILQAFRRNQDLFKIIQPRCPAKTPVGMEFIPKIRIDRRRTR